MAASLSAIGIATLHSNGPTFEPQPWTVVSGDAWVADALANFLLFLPLGAALSWYGLPRARAIVAGFLVSLLVEYVQSTTLVAGRSPSVLDLLTNSIGAATGWRLLQAMRMGALANPIWEKRFGILYGTGSLLGLLGTSWALGMEREHPYQVRLSQFEYAPGYGWLAAKPSEALVNGRSISHAGTGPVVAAVTNTPSTWAINVTLHGRDSSEGPRAIVFVHASTDTVPLLLLAQRGEDVTLDVARRGTRWGLRSPTLVSPGAIRRGGSECHTLHAQVQAGDATLSTSNCDRSEATTEMHINPLLGWTILIPVESTQRSLLRLGSALWIASLVAPMGWWCVTHRLFGVTWLGGILLASTVTPRFLGLSSVSLTDSIMLLCCFAAAAALRWRAFVSRTGAMLK